MSNQRVGLQDVRSTTLEVDALVYEHLVARGFRQSALALQIESSKSAASTTGTATPNPVSDLQLFVQSNDHADWLRYVTQLRQRDGKLRKAIQNICTFFVHAVCSVCSCWRAANHLRRWNC